jgi:hypothetical protein
VRATRFRGNNGIPLLVVFGFMSAPLPALASSLLYLEQYQDTIGSLRAGALSSWFS